MMRSSVKRYGIAPLPETHFPGAHVLVVQICASAPGRGLVLFGKMHESQQAGCHIWPVMLKLRAESLDLVEECAQVRSTLLFAASGPAAPAPLRPEGGRHRHRLIFAKRLLHRLLDQLQA